MTKSRVLFAIALLSALPMLSACGTSCDCPRCPNTTVVTPSSGDTTVVRPNGY